MTIKLKSFLGMMFLVVFMLQPQAANAQFSDSWEFVNAVKELDYSEMLERLGKGANINSRDGEGFSSIVIASDMANVKLMKFLLENGADPDAGILGSDETALMRRADAGDADSIRLLIEFGADINYANRSGETALMRAIRSRKARSIKVLIELGADMAISDYTGRTAMDYAEETRSSRIIKIVRDGLEQQ